MTEPLGLLLLVDDNRLNRQMLSQRLERRGYMTAEAEDGMQALKLVEQNDFDLILLDIMMPGLGGMEVLKALRQNYDRTELPVIMATSKDESRDIVEALKEGANDYITKPFDLEVVLARVGTQMVLKQTTDLLSQANQSLAEANQQLEQANQQMRRDLDAAARVQQSQLPDPSSRFDGCRFAWIYKPCEALAGDFLNVSKLDQNHIVLYLLDVSGHGVPAALLSVSVSRALLPTPDTTCLVSKPDKTDDKSVRYPLQLTPPAEVAEKLNRRFPTTQMTGQYFTMLYGIFDTETRELTFSSAGHQAPIFLPSQGNPSFLTSEGSFAIGMLTSEELDRQVWSQQTISLNPGDRLYLYSDGIPEAGVSGKGPFGQDRLLETIESSRSASLDESVEHVLNTLNEWCGCETYEDDVSMLALEVC